MNDQHDVTQLTQMHISIPPVGRILGKDRVGYGMPTDREGICWLPCPQVSPNSESRGVRIYESEDT